MNVDYTETQFEKTGRTTSEFLTTLSGALEECIAVLNRETSVAKTEQQTRELFRRMLVVWPVDSALRARRDFQIRLGSLLERQNQLLDGKSEFNEGLYREWLESMSVFTARSTPDNRGQDALLSYEITADRPSYDELHAQGGDEAVKKLSRTRGDLRVAMLHTDITEVLVLVESELLQIALRRQALMERELRALPEPSRPVEIEPLFSIETEQAKLAENDMKPLDRHARRRLARLILNVPRDAPLAAVSAAHATMHSAQRKRFDDGGERVLMVPRAVNPTQALVHWQSLTAEAIAAIVALDRDDTEFKTRVADMDALYTDRMLQSLLAGGGAYMAPYDVNLPAPTLSQATNEWARTAGESANLREALATVGIQETQMRFAAEDNMNALDYNVGALKKATRTLRVLEWAARLVYAASVAGTLRVYSAAIFDFETPEWTTLKTRLRDYVRTIEKEVGMYSYERLLRALAVQVRFVYATDIEGAADAYTRLGLLAFEQSIDANRAFNSYNTLADAAITHVLPTLSSAQRAFFSAVTNAVASSLRSIGRFIGRCAALIAMSGALAGAITYDASGAARGINSNVFADSLHASLDSDAHFAFETALPLVEHQSTIFTAYLMAQIQ